MKKCTILLLATLSTFESAASRDVVREGLVISVPDGQWKRWSGTCTGDWGWQRDGIGFSVGTRRYLKEDAEDRSSRDIYNIHRFTDLQPEVVTMMKPGGRLVRADSRKNKDGSKILVLEFDVAPTKDVPSRTRALYAFREAPDHRSAVEIRCAFAEKQSTVGMQVFDDALSSISDEKAPNQIPDPTAPSGRDSS